MVKTIVFDLHFTSTNIEPLTDAGRDFVTRAARNISGHTATPDNYTAAINAGLHVTFENAAVRDWATQMAKIE
jgi:hypothetical protein